MENARAKIGGRSARSIAATLGKLSKAWLSRKDPFRQKAVRRLVQNSGFSVPMAQAMLDAVFSELSEKKLLILLENEIGGAAFLDGFRKNPKTGAFQKAQGPSVITHVFSENLPQPSILSFVLGLLLRSANVGKTASGDPGFLDIYLESLKKADPSLAGLTYLLDAGDRKGLEEWFSVSEHAVVYGSDETLREIRKQIPAKCGFSGYGHKVSFSFYAREEMTRGNIKSLARLSAQDVWMADQRGCLSPAVIFIEEGGKVSVEDFCQALAMSLGSLAVRDEARVDFKRASDWKRALSQISLKLMRGESVRVWESDPPGRWAVIHEAKGRGFRLNSDRQVIFVRPAKSLESVLKSLRPFSSYLQAVAVEAPRPKRLLWAQELSQAGVNRVTRAGRLQFPPVHWHHDGRANLSEWVRWTDLED